MPKPAAAILALALLAAALIGYLLLGPDKQPANTDLDISGIWLVSETVSPTVSAACADFAGQRLEYPIHLTADGKAFDLQLFAMPDRAAHRLQASLSVSPDGTRRFGWEGQYPFPKRSELGSRALRHADFELSMDAQCRSMTGTTIWSWQRSDDSETTCSALLSRLRLERIGPGDCSGAEGVNYEHEPNSRTPPPDFAAATRTAIGASVIGTIVGQTTLTVEGDDYVDLFTFDADEAGAVAIALQLDRPGLVSIQVLSRASGTTRVITAADTDGGQSAQLATPELDGGAAYFIQLHALDTDGRPTGYRLMLRRGAEAPPSSPTAN